MSGKTVNPFNSALETGIRTLVILVESFPNCHDLSRLVQYDYLAVHSEDADGPPSLHPPLPYRSGELLVRRSLIESGIRLMMSRSLIRRDLHNDGFMYGAEEEAWAFLESLGAPYTMMLRQRAKWVISTFDKLSSIKLDDLVRNLFSSWTTEFYVDQKTIYPE
jgi:ABC-3C biological conflict system middle component